MVERILGNFQYQVAVLDDRLTGEAGERREAPGEIEQVVFELVRRIERVEAFAHDDVTGRAGTRHFARMLDADAATEQVVTDALARRSGKLGAPRADAFVRE